VNATSKGTSIDFISLARNEIFLIGSKKSLISDYFNVDFLTKLRKKFSNVDDQTLFVEVRETIRFLYLASYAQGGIFFPGNKNIDDIWHALIIETKMYRDFCSNLKLGSFVDHSGITYDDYSADRTTDELWEERMSWVASYVNAFGEITMDTFNCLPLFQDIAKRMKADLTGLNSLASALVGSSAANSNKRNRSSTMNIHYKNLDDFKNNYLVPNAWKIDSDPSHMAQALIELNTVPTESGSISNSDLVKIYEGSSALGFTLWQHLAAVERLGQSEDWQLKSSLIWRNILEGKNRCGLATTHIAKPGAPTITGTSVHGGFSISGIAPWASGYGFFDYIVIGFQTDNKIVFAVKPFPISDSENSSIERYKLEIMNGTSAVKLTFKNYFISDEDIVSSRSKEQPPANKRSKYLMPEIGIGFEALNLTVNLMKQSEHPKKDSILSACGDLKNQINELYLRSLNSGHVTTADAVEKDELIRNAVRLLILAGGSQHIAAKSTTVRMQKELMVLDVILQSPEVIMGKIKSISDDERKFC
jgi:hypothetical protein